jgi:N-acetylneuraminic acid mutarotase
MERMAQHTKNPEMLRELFESLGDDPFVIAECLIRPLLSERLSAQPHDFADENEIRTKLPVLSGYSLPAITGSASTCTNDTWSSLTDLPAHRGDHTAVWTGSEMIVFGGSNYDRALGSGDRYNPATDTWSKMSLQGAPIARYYHTAVWTGTEMIVWGGYTNDYVFVNSGARYDPTSDTWKPRALLMHLRRESTTARCGPATR